MGLESDQIIEATGTRRGPGRPRAIPPELFDTVLQLYAGGLGYRSITRHLWERGIATTHTTVRRLIKGEGAYAGCSSWHGTGRVVRGSGTEGEGE